jgi:WD40 repeat protein
MEVLQEIELSGDFVFSPSGRLFATATTNGLLRVWDLDERTRTHEFAVGTADFRPVAFSTDETRVWLIQGNGAEEGRSMLTEWDLRTQQQLRSIQGIRDRYLALHPERWVVWETWERAGTSFIFYDLRTGKSSQPGRLPRRLSAPGNGFPSTSPSGDLLVRTHEFGGLTVWEAASLSNDANPRPVHFLGGSSPLGNFSNPTFSPDGTRLLAGLYGAEAIKIWETRGYHEVLTLEADGIYFSNIGISPDGRFLGAMDSPGTIHLWHAPAWKEIQAEETRVRTALAP